MKNIIIALFLILSPLIMYNMVHSQTGGKVELTAQEILARVDIILNYQKGKFKGKMTHVKPDGTSHITDIIACISKTDYLLTFSNSERGDELRVLYKFNGEDNWVFYIHALKLVHKIGIDKYFPVLSTNFSFIDFSNSDLQSNYIAAIAGDAVIKGINTYRLKLLPIYQGGDYGLLTLYVSKENYLPLQIDYHDPEKMIFKTLTITRTIEKGSKIIPIQYEMRDIRNGTLTILKMSGFRNDIKFDKKIFNHQNLSKLK